ncbi:MAG: trypsin-like peptidase domain-containing protein [Phycisphaerales bacterium]|nr:trypsin-like peptidase domain-containing protein [Phycisphaerales bacterium]
MNTRGLHRYAPSVVVMIAAAVVLLAGPMLVDRLQYSEEALTTRVARQELRSSSLLAQMNNTFESIARAVEPSVVHITVQRSSRGMLSSLPSQGSGWVYDDQGHIVTNYHVIADASRIEVRFVDGLPHTAKVVGGDESTDIAVLRIDGRRVVPILRATDTSVRQGDLVFAFGSPFGFEGSMSFGIVSGQGRQAHLNSGGGYENYIQTDAAINPGNSGGPLTNIYGELVGMNMAIAVDPKDPIRSGRFTGVGLAIPLDIIEFAVEQIIAGVPIQRGGLGVELRDLPSDEALIAELGLPESGVLIESVSQGSPAEAAGLQPGDVILQAFGQSAIRMDTLRTMIHNLRPGSVVRLQVWRDKQLVPIDVVLGDWSLIDLRNRLEDLGLAASALTAEQARAAGLPAVTGVRLERVEPGLIAERLGLTTSMIVLEVGGKPVASVADLVKGLDPLSRGEAVDMVYLGSDGQRRTRTLHVGQGW